MHDRPRPGRLLHTEAKRSRTFGPAYAIRPVSWCIQAWCPAAKTGLAGGLRGPLVQVRLPAYIFRRRTVSSNTWFLTIRVGISARSPTTPILPFALATVGPLVDAVDPNLTPFRNRGGKLIVYHGFNDPDISPINSINYFDDVVRNFTGTPCGIPIAMLRAKTQMFFRLFMVPGMQHCSGGPGADQFDALTALEQWVEQGQAPDRITASKVTNGAVQFTRPSVSVSAVSAVQRHWQRQRRCGLDVCGKSVAEIRSSTTAPLGGERRFYCNAAPHLKVAQCRGS